MNQAMIKNLFLLYYAFTLSVKSDINKSTIKNIK